MDLDGHDGGGMWIRLIFCLLQLGGQAGMQYAHALSWIVIFISHCVVALSSFLNIRRLGQPNYGSVYKDGSFAIGRQPDFMTFAGIKHCLYCSRAQK